MQASRELFAMLAFAGLVACSPPAATGPTSQPPASAPTTAAAASTATASTAGLPANAAVKVARVQGFGLFLTDNADRTLYATTKDSKDTVTCTGTCADNWPAFIAPSTPLAPSNLNASLLTTFARSDGKMQVEYDGHPLYYFGGDKNPGDVKGQGIGNVWHVLSPRGNPMMNAYSPGATSTPAP